MIVGGIENIDKRKCVVYFENEEFFPLYKGELYKYNIEEGSEISVDTYEYIKNNIVKKRGRERAMYILKSSDKTEKQLRDKLRRGMYPEDVIEDIIIFLRKHKYIDDEEYARCFIRTYSESIGLKAIKIKLAERGISREVYENVIEEDYIKKHIDTKEIIYKYLEKKKYNREMNIKDKNRVTAFLLRKGFEYQDIYDCLKNTDELIVNRNKSY